MGWIKKKIKKLKKLVNPIATPVEHLFLSNYEQGKAIQANAKSQTAIVRAAADAQAAHLNQQAQGAANAQQQAVNQANLAAKLRDQEQTNMQAPADSTAASNPDPRRKYRAGGGFSMGGLGGGNGGLGIRLT